MLGENHSLSPSPFAVVLTPIQFDLDPRHLYWKESLDSSFERVEIWQFLGTKSRPSQKGVGVCVSQGTQNSVTVITLESSHKSARWAMEEFSSITSGTESEVLERFLDCPSESSSVTHTYLLAQVERMIAALGLASTLDFPSLVIANDLISAIAASAVWADDETKIIYDAQEVFVDMYRSSPADKMSKTEEDFWLNLETLVCSKVDQVVTVSPGIAELYSQRHSVVASVVPNWVPLSHEVSSSNKANPPIKFVYMGHAAPHRGLEDLIRKWDASMDQATLDLFIPERPYTQSLRELIEKCVSKKSHLKITLNPPVPSDEMIETLAGFDVGIIPYDHPYPYSHCSPNKLGQYLAAGLAIVSNELPFVQQTIESARCGEVFKWSELGSFEKVVHDICNNSDLSELKANSQSAFHESFNWDLSVKKFAESTNTFQNLGNEGPDDFWQQVFADASRIKIEGNLIAMIPEIHQDSRFNVFARLKGLDLQENIQLRRLFGRLQRIPLVGSITKAFAKRIL